MNENLKKGLLIGVIILGVGVAAYSGMNMMTGEKPEVIKRIEGDPNHSMKRMEMEAQKSGTAVGDTIANGAPVQGGREERDLGGPLTGNK